MTSQIVILGGGPAGLTLARQILRSSAGYRVLLIEREQRVGGLSASFQRDGIWFDDGSHRLHEFTPDEILRDLHALLGPDLLHRPRMGRIRIGDRFVGFPLRPLDLALHLPPSFILGVGGDLLVKPFRRPSADGASYASVLLQGLGPTICEAFYFPFARKLWGLAPERIAAVQAQRRVATGNVASIVRRIVSALPGLRRDTPGHGYYYPRRGFGQISEALADDVRRRHGQIRLSTTLREIHVVDGGVTEVVVGPTDASVDGETLRPELVLSTIPLPDMIESLRPLPPEVAEHARHLRYRGIVFCHLVLDTPQFTPYDAHYFPAIDLPFSRISEPKNYSAATEPVDRTGLCVEIPCWPEDEVWRAPEGEIVEMVLREMARARLPVRATVKEAFITRQRHAYPSYDLDYEGHLEALVDCVAAIPNLVTLGRQGLFAHDNIHHAMEVSYRAAECVQGGGGDGPVGWDAERWRGYREQFREHVVVD